MGRDTTTAAVVRSLGRGHGSLRKLAAAGSTKLLQLEFGEERANSSKKSVVGGDRNLSLHLLQHAVCAWPSVV